MIVEHGIAGRQHRHKASSLGAAASAALLLPLGPAPADEPLAAPRAGHYAIETVEGRRLASEVTGGRLMEAAD